MKHGWKAISAQGAERPGPLRPRPHCQPDRDAPTERGWHGITIPEPDLIETVRTAIEINAIGTFSYAAARERDELRPGTEEVCRNLLESGEPLADVLADEWAFVTSQSLAVLVERVGDALGGFTRAGAVVVGVSKDRMKAALEAVQRQIPPVLLDAMKRVDDGWESVPKFPKFILAGGGFAAGFLLPPLGIGMVRQDCLWKAMASLLAIRD